MDVCFRLMSISAIGTMLKQEFDKWSSSRRSKTMDYIMAWIVQLPYLTLLERQKNWRGIYVVLKDSQTIKLSVLEKCFNGKGCGPKRIQARQHWKDFMDSCVSMINQSKL